MTFVGQLLRHARAVEVAVDPGLSVGELRSSAIKRRDQRAVPAAANIERLLHEPPFTGRADAWDRPYEAGEHVYHGALYFCTLLNIYCGLRREESCGLATDDVVDDAPHPYILIRFNDIRRIKNPQSVRSIALHPELIRLGFLDYVGEMRSLGHVRLFQDLYSETTQSPLGDRYYDELLPALRHAQVTPLAEAGTAGLPLKIGPP